MHLHIIKCLRRDSSTKSVGFYDQTQQSLTTVYAGPMTHPISVQIFGRCLVAICTVVQCIWLNPCVKPIEHSGK